MAEATFCLSFLLNAQKIVAKMRKKVGVKKGNIGKEIPEKHVDEKQKKKNQKEGPSILNEKKMEGGPATKASLGCLQ